MNIIEQIERIQTKLQHKLKEAAVLKKENEQIKKQLEQLKNKMEELTSTLEIVQHQNAILKASTQNLDAADKKEFESTINKYIRDIEKCMALLSE